MLYQRKGSGRGPLFVERFDPRDFLARLLQHVPAPRLHQVRYYGHYSNVARAKRAAVEGGPQAPAPSPDAAREPTAGERRRLRKLWAQLIRRVYEVDPLLCRECGGAMRILAFVLEPAVIRKILAYLEAKGRHPARGPPPGAGTAAPLAS